MVFSSGSVLRLTTPLAASLLCKNIASDSVNAAHTMNATVVEFPTRKRGAYVVLYVNSGIHALKAYLSLVSVSC